MAEKEMGEKKQFKVIKAARIFLVPNPELKTAEDERAKKFEIYRIDGRETVVPVGSEHVCSIEFAEFLKSIGRIDQYAIITKYEEA